MFPWMMFATVRPMIFPQSSQLSHILFYSCTQGIINFPVQIYNIQYDVDYAAAAAAADDDVDDDDEDDDDNEDNDDDDAGYYHFCYGGHNLAGDDLDNDDEDDGGNNHVGIQILYWCLLIFFYEELFTHHV